MSKVTNANTIVIWPSIFISILLSPLFGFSQIGEINDNQFKLIVKWKNPKDTIALYKIRRDPVICCNFTFVVIKSDTTCSLITTKEGEVIGTIMGSLSVGFIKMLVPKIVEFNMDPVRKREESLVEG